MFFTILPGIIHQDKVIRENSGVLPTTPDAVDTAVLAIDTSADTGTQGDWTTSAAVIVFEATNVDSRATAVELHSDTAKIGDFTEANGRYLYSYNNPQDDSKVSFKIVVKTPDGDTETALQEVTMEAPAPVANYSYINYYSSWATSWFNAANAVDPNHRRMANTPGYFSDIMIAFVRPNMTFDKTAPDITRVATGLDYPNTGPTPHEGLKDDVEKAQAKGQKVLVSVGGATYGRPDISDAWQNMYDEAKYIATAGTGSINRVNTPTMQSMIEFIEYFNLDGIDLDFEDDPAWWDGHTVGTTRWQKYLDVYYHLLMFNHYVADRAAAILGKPMEKGTACWSTGWHVTPDTNADVATPNASHGLTSVWGGRAGRERAMFGGFTHPELGAVNARNFVTKYINMSYDFGPLGSYADDTEALTNDVTYDPINVYVEAREIVTDIDSVMTVGICPEPFGWQADGSKMMVKDADCAPSGNHRTRLYRDGYNRVIDKPFSAENLATRFLDVVGNNVNDGFILWAGYKVAGTYTYNGTPSANATTASKEIARVLDLADKDNSHDIHT
ncbi:hypothetical protein SM033_00302 [Vibrio phage vB_VpaM_sm033]|nr:hypothetical protein SM033_00302 [Vibrio phage vB_VpaM_sm033]